MINTDADRNEIMNTGIKFVGYGKALFPPHPEDLQPEIDCCTTEPCVEKKPCQTDIVNINLMNVGPKTPGFRFAETKEKSSETMNATAPTGGEGSSENSAEINEEERGSLINNNLKFAETSKGGVLFIPPPMMYEIPYMNNAVRGPASSSFLETDSKVLTFKNRHGKSHHSKSMSHLKKSGISAGSEATEKSASGAVPVNLNVLSSPSMIVEADKNSTVFEYNPNTGRRGR